MTAATRNLLAATPRRANTKARRAQVNTRATARDSDAVAAAALVTVEEWAWAGDAVWGRVPVGVWAWD